MIKIKNKILFLLGQLFASQKSEIFDSSAQIQSNNMIQERKAPGFERPNLYSSNCQVPQDLSPNNGNVLYSNSNYYLDETAITSFSNLNL